MGSDALKGAWGFTLFDQFYLPFAVLFGMTIVMLVALLILLKGRDPV